MKLFQEFKIDAGKVAVFDDVISPRQHFELSKSISELSYNRTQSDTQKTRDSYLYYVAHLNLKLMRKHSLGIAAMNLAASAFPEQKSKLMMTYVNRISYGDVSFAHRDCRPDLRDLTAIYFGNSEWLKDWGGETIFFDKKFNALFAVTPRPRRMVLFNGNILHRVGIPSRICFQSRFTVALKFIGNSPL